MAGGGEGEGSTSDRGEGDGRGGSRGGGESRGGERGGRLRAETGIKGETKGEGEKQGEGGGEDHKGAVLFLCNQSASPIRAGSGGVEDVFKGSRRPCDS